MKPKKKKKKTSFLARLLGKRPPAEKKPASKPRARAAEPTAREQPRPLTRLDRSIAEIKQMMHIGQKDPERLAMIIGRMLKAQRDQKQKDQEKLDQLVRDILSRPDSDGNPPPPASP